MTDNEKKLKVMSIHGDNCSEAIIPEYLADAEAAIMNRLYPFGIPSEKRCHANTKTCRYVLLFVICVGEVRKVRPRTANHLFPDTTEVQTKRICLKRSYHIANWGDVMLYANQKTVSYALYSAKTEVFDANGYRTGQYTESYGTPIETRMSIDRVRGTAKNDGYGITEPVVLRLTTSDMCTDFDLDTKFFIEDKEFKVLDIERSLALTKAVVITVQEIKG